VGTVLDVSAEVWVHDGPGGWHFVTLPPEAADQVEQECAGVQRGFGSVRVEVTVGTTTWRTSVFPDKRSGSFVLPLKVQVRRQEDLRSGDVVDLQIQLEP
jgi:hypothetical protein